MEWVKKTTRVRVWSEGEKRAVVEHNAAERKAYKHERYLASPQGMAVALRRQTRAMQEVKAISNPDPAIAAAAKKKRDRRRALQRYSRKSYLKRKALKELNSA